MNRARAVLMCLLGVLIAAPVFAGDTVYYYYTDAQGSPVAETDAHGNVSERTQYAPYGQVLNRPEHDGPGYTGHEEDTATGLTNMQQRYGDKAIGRMLSIDPLGVDTITGANFNRYAYANDNPYRYTDPDGRQTTGEYIDQQAQAASDSGNYVATYAWAFAGTAWKYLGAESVSQVVDKGAGASTGDKVMAAVAVVTLGKGEEATTIAKDVGEGAVDAAKGIEKAVADAQGPRFATGKLRQQVMDKGRQADGSVHCAYCGKPTATQSDHVVPYSKGGPTKIENLQPSCASCNASKGAKDLGKEWIPPKDRQDQ